MGRLNKLFGRMAGTGNLNKPKQETKKSAVGGLVPGAGTGTAWVGLGAPRWTTRSYEKLAQEGYRKNVIANRCVRMIAESAGGVPWLLYRGDQLISRHPLLDLLRRPNPMQGGAELFESLYAFLNISGNAYLESAELMDGTPGELYVLRPDRMKIVPGHNGWPRAYEYSVSGRSHIYDVDMLRGISPVMHLKTFHPLDDHYGLSPLEAAAFGIDIHNAAGGWNKALFDNAARPSGALVYEPRDGSSDTLSQDQFDRLKEEMETTYQGAINAGRPMLLEGGLRWQQMAFSPQDMEFIQGKHVSAREIALAFGVPPMLLSVPGDNTYSNYQEANRALWRQTILPLLDKTCSALNNWLAPKFGDDLRLDYDSDVVPALIADRNATWDRVNAAGFLTVNEKRAAVGMGPIEGGDTLPAPLPAGPVAMSSFVPTGDRKMATKAELMAKIWYTHIDDHTRESHLAADGQVRLVEDMFLVGEALLSEPRDPEGPPAETYNCRCRMEVVRVADLTEGQKRQLESVHELKPLPMKKSLPPSHTGNPTIIDPGNLSASDEGITFIANWEGYRSEVYKDSAGLDTIGYGHLLQDEEAFSEGIDETQAMELLKKDVAFAIKAVQENVSVNITQSQFDALVSFTFNVGGGALERSTLLKKLNEADFESAAEEFLKWDKIRDQDGVAIRIPGLTGRRVSERQLFLNGTYE